MIFFVQYSPAFQTISLPHSEQKRESSQKPGYTYIIPYLSLANSQPLWSLAGKKNPDLWLQGQWKRDSKWLTGTKANIPFPLACLPMTHRCLPGSSKSLIAKNAQAEKPFLSLSGTTISWNLDLLHIKSKEEIGLALKIDSIIYLLYDSLWKQWDWKVDFRSGWLTCLRLTLANVFGSARNVCRKIKFLFQNFPGPVYGIHAEKREKLIMVPYWERCT